jgi:hypothetical protein
MEQIDGHRVSLSHGVARGLVHGLISYGQSHKMIIRDFGYMAPDQARSTFRLPELQKTGGLSSTASRNPKTQNVKCEKLFRHSGYRDFEKQGVAPPLHRESPKPKT